MLYTGVIEDRYDPLKLGRCKVRIVGLHTHDVAKLPTADLPWAVPIQPITSAAMSGIGQTPLGFVEGTWVVVMFQDDDKQYPIILGSIGGIPQSSSSDISIDDSTLKIKIDGELTEGNTQSNVVLDGSGKAVTDGSGNPIGVGAAPVATVLENTNTLKRAAEFAASANCIALIKRFEGLRLNAYQDVKGIWTVGYGTIFINNSPVTEGMTITSGEAEKYLLSDLNTKFVPVVQRNTRALITQSMFDALCCFTYNVGPTAFAKSTLVKDLNASKYLDAAAGFLQWDKATINGVLVSVTGLTKRRIAEKDLFLAEGVPNIAGELPPQTAITSSVSQPNSNSSSLATQSASSASGFVDPTGKYPLYFNEPDTNRLARHEDINKTIVYKKEAGLIEGVETADGSTWDQSPIPYNAQYPFNHVMQSESGHILEFDDTPHSERVHLYHKSGTFTEIDANGTQVNRIIGDNYEILERNGYVQINGSLNVTVDGAQNVLVKNGMNLSVRGVANINVYNDANLNVSGSLNMSVGETFAVKAASVIIEGDSVNIKSNGAFVASSSGSFDINAGGTLSADGSSVNIANGAANAQASGLTAPGSKQSPEMPDFGSLTVVTRGFTAAGQYETPEDGDSTAYQQKQILTGAIKKEDIDSGTKSGVESAPPSTVTAVPQSCDAIMMKQTFDPSFILSKHFTLATLTQNGSRMPIVQMGFSVQEIVCNMKGLAENCLEPIYNLYPNMVINSGFRRPGDAANSAPKSDHYSGSAADIRIPNLDRAGHYEAIQKIQALIPYHQLLLEYQGAKIVWIHVSFKYTGARKEVFTMRDHKRISDFGQFTLVA
jgi:GH24 family phage-related lysozyme (muramidase)